MSTDSDEYSLRQTIFRASAYAISPPSRVSSSIDFTYDIRPDVPDKLFGSPYQLRTVISSLMKEITRYPSITSIQSEPKQSRVTLHCKLLEKGEEDVLLHFCIRRTCSELGPVKLSLVLDYFQLEDPIEDITLYSYYLNEARQEALNLHGNIWVDSEPHKGTRFFFTMRSQVSTREVELPSPLSESAPYSNKTILLVDTSQILTGVADLIERWGPKTIMIHDMTSLVDSDDEPDTIIASSMEEVTKLRSFKHLKWTPIILLAPPPLDPDLTWCIKNNIISHKYITMPIKPSDLFMAVTEGLSTYIEWRGPSYEILIAEDNSISQIICGRLQSFGHVVDITENGQDVLEMYAKRVEEGLKKYDLIMMNPQAIQRIRSYETENHLTPISIIGTKDYKTGIPWGTLNETDHVTTKPVRLVKPEVIDGLLSEQNGGAKSQRYTSFY